MDELHSQYSRIIVKSLYYLKIQYKHFLYTCILLYTCYKIALLKVCDIPVTLLYIPVKQIQDFHQ